MVLRHAVDELGARCLDGSPPVYYMSTGLQQDKWVIYHEVRTYVSLPHRLSPSGSVPCASGNFDERFLLRAAIGATELRSWKISPWLKAQRRLGAAAAERKRG